MNAKVTSVKYIFGIKRSAIIWVQQDSRQIKNYGSDGVKNILSSTAPSSSKYEIDEISFCFHGSAEKQLTSH